MQVPLWILKILILHVNGDLRNFDQIVGQDLPVKMLKNSLYLNHYFPVYLFAGQRGCGKTSTARVFAAAINCEQLSAFSKRSKKCIIALSCM